MSVPQRYGITFPFDGIPLLEQRELVRELVDLGYTDLWSAESGGYDAFIPLAVAAQWAPELRLGTAIVPAYTRGAHTLASTVASMCQAAPGRFALGIGTSSNVIVERWNGMKFDKPYQRVRDTIRFLRAAWPFGFATQTLIFLVMQTVDATLRMRLRRPWFWPFRRVLRSHGQRIPTFIPQANEFAGKLAAR